MQVGKYECDVVKREDVLMYNERILEFFRSMSEDERVGHLVLSNPNSRKFVGIASAYQTEASVASEYESRLFELMFGLEGFEEEKDYCSIYDWDLKDDVRQSRNVIVVYKGKFYSGRLLDDVV